MNQRRVAVIMSNKTIVARKKTHVVTFYFVHNDEVFPKPYHIIVPSEKLFEEMQPGTTWVYCARNLYGYRWNWQKIMVVLHTTFEWEPRFDKESDKHLKRKKLNRRQQKNWYKFNKLHHVL